MLPILLTVLYFHPKWVVENLWRKKNQYSRLNYSNKFVRNQGRIRKDKEGAIIDNDMGTETTGEILGLGCRGIVEFIARNRII